MQLIRVPHKASVISSTRRTDTLASYISISASSTVPRTIPPDFLHCRTDDGKTFRTLNILDEFSRACLAIRAKRKLTSTDVIYALTVSPFDL